MKITMVVPDNLVIVDGVGLKVNLQSLDFTGAKVMQWGGSAGWLEYHDGRPNFEFNRPDAMALEPFASALRMHAAALAATASV